jgi:hypothetical protein
MLNKKELSYRIYRTSGKVVRKQKTDSYIVGYKINPIGKKPPEFVLN